MFEAKNFLEAPERDTLENLKPKAFASFGSGAVSNPQVFESSRQRRKNQGMPIKKTKLPPHWMLDGNVKRCSVCGHPLLPQVEASIDAVFAEHVRTAHKPSQTPEDSSQAALRVVREATANK